MTSILASAAIKAAIKPIIKQVCKKGIKGLLKKNFRSKLMGRIKQKMLKKGMREGRKAVKDEIEEILNDPREMSGVEAAVEQKMDKWLDSKTSFSAWDLIPGVGEARTIMQLKELLGSNAADVQAEEYACEEITIRIKRRRGRR